MWSYTTLYYIYDLDYEPDSDKHVKIYDAVYKNFIEEVDAVDNGIEDREGIPKLVHIFYSECF